MYERQGRSVFKIMDDTFKFGVAPGQPLLTEALSYAEELVDFPLTVAEKFWADRDPWFDTPEGQAALDVAGKQMAERIDLQILEALQGAGKIMDEQKVPTAGRIIWPYNHNGA